MANCEWRDGETCCVPYAPDQLTEWNGRHYCALHLPLLSGKSIQSISQYVPWLQQQQTLHGYELPKSTYDFEPSATPAEIRECRFAAGSLLRFGASKFRISHCDFGLSTDCDYGVRITPKEKTSLHFSQCTNHSRLVIEGTGIHTILFEKHIANKPLCIFKLAIRILVLNKVEFHAPLLCDGITPTQLHQFTDNKFHHGAFLPEAENSYRHLRKLVGDLKNRNLEGYFFALEMRCHRKALSGCDFRKWAFEFKPDRIASLQCPIIIHRRPILSNLFARLASKIYDVTSLYGQSYERAFAMLAALQLGFGSYYAYRFQRFGAELRIDWDLALFTLKQVIKPFELMARRPAPANAQPSVFDQDFGAAFQLLLASHSALSIIVIALFTLALRWRFRRE